MAPDPSPVVFRLQLPAGVCVGIRLPAPDQVDAFATRELHEQERLVLAGLPPARRPSWAAGRAALRTAIVNLGEGAPPPLLPNGRGAPTLPPGAAGSISHKGDLAVAIADRLPAARAFELGIDLEDLSRPPRQNIQRRVLTGTEQGEVAALPPEERLRETLMRFSLKESLYKAVDPHVQRYVSFQEAQATPRSDGTAVLSLAPTRGEGPFQIEAWWLERPPNLITVVRLRPR